MKKSNKTNYSRMIQLCHWSLRETNVSISFQCENTCWGSPRNWQTWESTPWPRPYYFHQSITYDSISCLVKLFGTPQDVVKASKQMIKWREARWGPAGHCWGPGLTPWLGNREPASRTAQPKHRGCASELTALQSNDRCFSMSPCRVFFKRRTKHQLEYHIT